MIVREFQCNEALLGFQALIFPELLPVISAFVDDCEGTQSLHDCVLHRHDITHTLGRVF